MPQKQKIERDILAGENNHDRVRRRLLKDLHRATERDIIVYASSFLHPKRGYEGHLAMTLQDLQAFMAALHQLKGDQLDLVIHSPGGSLEACDQIVQYLRMKYRHIRAIVPQNAMSAATMLCCACDEIVLGKHSALGPIDPQITFPSPQGNYTAAVQAILDEFEDAKREIRQDPASAPLWAARIQKLPPGFYNQCKTVTALARDKTAEWLRDRMFREDTDATRAEGIAQWLGDAVLHKTHGRPIGIQMAKEKGLKVTCLEENDDLQDKVLSVFHALCITFETTNCVKLVENHLGKGYFLNARYT